MRSTRCHAGGSGCNSMSFLRHSTDNSHGFPTPKLALGSPSSAGCGACHAEGWGSSWWGGVPFTSLWSMAGHVQRAGSGGGSASLQGKRHFLKVRLLLLLRWCETVYFIRYLFKSFNYHISCFQSLYSEGTIVRLNERLPPANFVVQTAWSSLCLKYKSRSGLNACGKRRETLETKGALTQVLFLRLLFTHWRFLK